MLVNVDKYVLPDPVAVQLYVDVYVLGPKLYPVLVRVDKYEVLGPGVVLVNVDVYVLGIELVVL